MFDRIFGAAPFARLSLTHAFGTGADALFTVSLAGSLFFNVSIGAARPRIIAYLMVTLTPFVFLTPLVGPLIDRFGHTRRVIAAITCLGRGILCLFAAGDIRSVFLYPEAFGILVLEKAYAVTKSAIVPGLVDDHADLVAANSRLTRLSTVAGIIGGTLAAGVLRITSGGPVLRIAALVYFLAAIFALRVPSDKPKDLPAASLERQELQSPKVLFAAGAMLLFRGAIGFLVFLAAFRLKRAGEPAWFFGVVAACSIAGGLAGTVVSPLLRRRLARDEPLLTIALLFAGTVALASALRIGRASVPLAVLAVSSGATIGRQGFDSILQRDAPDAARGRSFARFETVFQLFWVLGALGGVLLQPSTRSGLVILGGLFAVALAIYLAGTREGARRSAFG